MVGEPADADQTAVSAEELAKSLSRNGQLLLPLVELVEQGRCAVGECGVGGATGPLLLPHCHRELRRRHQIALGATGIELPVFNQQRGQ